MTEQSAEKAVTTGDVGRASYATDCLTCGDVAYIEFGFGTQHRRWALRHVNANPGHTVHMERTTTVRYVSPRVPPGTPTATEENTTP